MVSAKRLSDFDFGGVLKDAHDPNAHGLRTIDANSRVPGEYSRVIFTKNSQDSITDAVFYRGTTAQKTRIKFFGDISGSLNSTHWLINSSEDAVRYYIWYNVDGLGVNPNIPGYIGFEIPLSSNDPAALVCLATRRYLEGCEHFTIEPNGDDVLLIENVDNGDCTDSSDVDTGFAITTTNIGITKRICSLQLPEETLFKYVFNHAERKFELLPNSLGTVDANIISPIPLPVSVTGLTVNAGAIQNILAPTSGTEYEFTLGLGVHRFELKSRLRAKINLAFVSGESSINYRTIEMGNTYKEENILLTVPLTLYFQSTKDNDVLEITTYS